MKKNKHDPNDNNKEIKRYQKNSFIKRLPFGLKATFIKYWFYGAAYFFCFMGLGLIIKSDENLLLATGLITGVFFDIALYNIFLLFADTREEASKWWFFKSKKFYSIFINVVVLIGLFFLFHTIIIPIKKSMPPQFDWLFQEPLTAALFLTILDTALVWIKNLAISLFKSVFISTSKVENKNEPYIKILDLTPVSISIEINSKCVYYSDKPYNILLNNEIIFKKINTNSITIYDLKPDTQYKLAINHQTIVFITPKIYKAYKVYEGNDIQKVIDMADQYSLIIVNKGKYEIKSLVLKNNIILYLRKGSLLIASTNEDDYPIISSFDSRNNEVNGVYKGEIKDIRQSIIHIDHLKNVKIVGEGTIDGQAQLSSNWKKQEFEIAPPHLIYINHSSDISIIGLNLKNSPQCSVHSFFSNNINLINLEITNSLDSIITDGIMPQCSSDVNIVGNHFSNLNDCVAIKSGKNDIATYHVSSKNITIKNCYMENSKSAIAIGNECSSGIHSVNISFSSFANDECGINIKTSRGSGKDAIIKDVSVNNIKMENVSTPIIANMFYANNPNNNVDYVLNRNYIPIDANTPYLENFVFKNIVANNFEYCSGYFDGLPEKYIYEIKIVDSIFTAKEISKEGSPIDINNINKYSKNGFIVKNVRSLNLANVKLENIVGDRVNLDNVSEFIDN